MLPPADTSPAGRARPLKSRHCLFPCGQVTGAGCTPQAAPRRAHAACTAPPCWPRLCTAQQAAPAPAACQGCAQPLLPPRPAACQRGPAHAPVTPSPRRMSTIDMIRLPIHSSQDIQAKADACSGGMPGTTAGAGCGEGRASRASCCAAGGGGRAGWTAQAARCALSSSQGARSPGSRTCAMQVGGECWPAGRQPVPSGHVACGQGEGEGQGRTAAAGRHGRLWRARTGRHVRRAHSSQGVGRKREQQAAVAEHPRRAQVALPSGRCRSCRTTPPRPLQQ